MNTDIMLIIAVALVAIGAWVAVTYKLLKVVAELRPHYSPEIGDIVRRVGETPPWVHEVVGINIKLRVAAISKTVHPSIAHIGADVHVVPFSALQKVDK